VARADRVARDPTETSASTSYCSSEAGFSLYQSIRLNRYDWLCPARRGGHAAADWLAVPVAVSVDGHDLDGIRSRIKAANAEIDALRRAPAPHDIEARVRAYIRGLAPKVRGIGVGEQLSIVWPGAQGVHIRAHLRSAGAGDSVVS
jgi:hypothetical protein